MEHLREDPQHDVETRWADLYGVTRIIVMLDSFTCETGMSKIGSEMQLKNICASFLTLPDDTYSTGGQHTYPLVTFLWHALERLEV